MYFVFYKTSDVFAAEEILQANDIHTEVVPTPVQDKAYCGVCVFVYENDVSKSADILKGFDYKQVK
ncbi:MAG: DUF3343 domain-containing protein [Caulobacteraceae bacterium]